MIDYIEDGGDVERLKSFYKNNADFRAVLDFINSREITKGWYEVSVLTEQMKTKVVGIKRSEIIRALKMLETLRCGWFKTGRRGWPTRFEFRVSPTQLQGLATGTISLSPAAIAPVKMLEHRFRLRPDLEISFELPDDLSKREVLRVAEFLKTLPFDDAGARLK
jgi:hypothetical protein